MQWQGDIPAHNRPPTYSEWSVRRDNAGPYIAAVARWFAYHHVAYEGYCASDDAYRGKLSDDSAPYTPERPL